MKLKSDIVYFLSYLFFSSCSEPSLEEQAISFYDANLSEKKEEIRTNKKIIRSPDGLQFTKSLKEGNQSQTVGLTEKGKISFEGKMKNGKPHGEWTTFFPDGRPRWNGNKNEGISHGPYTMWYQEGRKKMEGEYKNGQKHGQSTMWHLNGAKWKEQKHMDGKPSGKWRTWNNQGVLIEEIDHTLNGPMFNPPSP